MKTINRIFLLLATFCAAVACSDDDTELTIYSLKFEPGSINLGVGESRRLVPISDPPVDGIQYEWKSVDERIATVDAAGLVTGVSAGSTEIRAFYGDNRMARCLVSVVENTSSLPDPTPALAADLSQELIFSSNQLAYKGTVMQCFDFYDENGYIYYTQCAADSQTGNRWLVVLGRQKRNEAPSGDYMRLQWFGHGTLVVAEKAEDGDYVWVASNGTISGSDYTNNLTFSRIKYQKGAVLSHYGGDTFYLSRYVDAAGTAWDVRDVQPSIDFVNRRLLIGCRTNDMRHNVVYDLDDVLALENESVEVTRTWGGELAAEGVLAAFRSGYVLQSDAILLESYQPKAMRFVYAVHRSDFLFKAQEHVLMEMARKLTEGLPYDHEPLQFLLIDGEFHGASVGHFRNGPYDLLDVVCDLPDAQSRREEILEAVSAVNFGRKPQRFLGAQLTAEA